MLCIFVSPLEINFEDLQSEEDTLHTSQTVLVMDEEIEDASKVRTSEQGSVETITAVYEPEENYSSSDNCESESGISLSINTESTFYFSHDEIDNQVVHMTITEAQQLNDAVGECTAEEGNMPSDLEADVFETDRTEEKHIETLDVEYEPQASPPMSRERQTPEETSSEENESDSDNCESEASNSLSFNTESTFCLSLDEIDNQVVKGMMAEAQQLNDAAGECTAEEGNMLSNLEAGVSEKDSTEEEHTESLNVEYEPQVSSPMNRECQTPEEQSSESDEELPENYNTPQSFLCKSVDIKEEPFLATGSKNADKYYVRDDMKEFTEEDQEQIEESLADYPSDLSHSESEEPAENSRVQPFTLVDISSSDNHSTDRMEDLFNAENVNLENQESPDLDYNSGIKGLEVEMISASVDVDLSIQREDEDEDDVQGSFINDINTEEDIKNKEDAVDLSGVSDETDDTSESSGDDRSSSQEETNIISSVNQEEEINHVSQYNYLTEDMLRVDNDIGYMYKNTGVLGAISPEKKDEEHSLFWESGFTNTSSISYNKESNTELHHSTGLVQSDTALEDHEVSSSETSDNVEDTKNVLTELMWASSLIMDGDILHMEEYDWDLTGEGEDLVPVNSGEGENQENEEEALVELDIDDNEEGNERDWELEKTRIEAFYQFYGDQAEPEDEVGKFYRGHTVPPVTFTTLMKL